jgi:hypothetical protein
MFRLFSAALTIGLVSCVSYAQATFAPGDPAKAVSQPVSEPVVYKPKVRRIKKYFFDVGVDLRNYNYEEPGFVKHTGLMYGVWADFLTNTDWGMFGFDTAFDYGNALHYDGGICDIDLNTQVTTCSPYSTDNVHDLIAKTNVFAYLPASDILRFKVGLGYRYLSDSVAESGFYLRTGTWVYIPLAMEILDDSNSNFRFKYGIAYDYVVWGGIKSNLSEANSRFDDVYMSQTGYGIDLNAELRYQTRYVFGLFYQTWNLNISDEVISGGAPFHEPANNSRTIGLKFGYDFY